MNVVSKKNKKFLFLKYFLKYCNKGNEKIKNDNNKKKISNIIKRIIFALFKKNQI